MRAIQIIGTVSMVTILSSSSSSAAAAAAASYKNSENKYFTLFPRTPKHCILLACAKTTWSSVFLTSLNNV